MSALPIIITTAGLAALVNANNNGVSGVVIDKMGVSAQQVALTAATTVIPGEIKRLGAVAGQVVSDDTLYVSATDQTADTYSVRTVALYLNDGTLFAAYSQAAPLVEKAEPSMAVLEASVKLAAPLAGVIEFTGGGWLNPPASETVAGVMRLATVDDALQGVNHSRAVTSKGLKAVRDAIMATVSAAFEGVYLALSGKSPTGHGHDASAVTTGTFLEARIPNLPQDRITNLVNALAAKAAAAITITAGNGLTGGGNLGANRTITLGAPATVTGASTNTVSAEGHSHDLSIGTADVDGLDAALTGKADRAITITAGNGLTGGGTLAGHRTLTLATPGTITGVSTNWVDPNSHYHQLSIGTADVSGLDGALAARALNTVQVVAGNGLSGGGALSANRTLTLGTPGTITKSTTNSVTATSHTHALTIATDDVSGLTAALEAAAPVGSVMHFAKATAPTGWLICNGVAVSRTTYADLFAVIGTTFGVGNGTSTFNVPDLRGEFVRGFDAGRGVDSGRVFGSAQADELRAHDHLAYAGTGQGSTNIPAVDNDGNIANRTNPTSMTGGVETRPRNVALLPCIKF